MAREVSASSFTRHGVRIHLFWGRNHALELAQEDLCAHYGVKFFDPLGDFLRGEPFDALDEDFFGSVRLNRDETLGRRKGTDRLVS